MGWGQTGLWECPRAGKRASCPTLLLVPETLFPLPPPPTSPFPGGVTVLTWASWLGDSTGTAWDTPLPAAARELQWAAGLLPGTSALWRWALGRQGGPRGQAAALPALTGTTPRGCHPGCVPCLSGIDLPSLASHRETGHSRGKGGHFPWGKVSKVLGTPPPEEGAGRAMQSLGRTLPRASLSCGSCRHGHSSAQKEEMQLLNWILLSLGH